MRPITSLWLTIRHTWYGTGPAPLGEQGLRASMRRRAKPQGSLTRWPLTPTLTANTGEPTHGKAGDARRGLEGQATNTWHARSPTGNTLRHDQERAGKPPHQDPRWQLPDTAQKPDSTTPPSRQTMPS